MREIVLDTETTGLDPAAGHRIVELACIELVNHLPTGRTFREYINPERPMPEEAQRIHGLSDSFLSDKPRFAEIADAFLEFIGDAPLVIHNADFDIGFLNAELRLIGRPALEAIRATDTVRMARQRFPGAQASLDALCRRFAIDNSARSYHGALLDCELLAEVYLELCGGRQPGLALVKEAVAAAERLVATSRPQRPPRPHAPMPAELLAHEALLDGLTDPVWRQ